MSEEKNQGVVELVKSGAVLMRVENDSMLSAAIQRPRKEEEIVKAALRELDIMPEEAGTAYYSIPFKDRAQDGSVRIVKVEGPSIKAAMSLSRRWGNCSVSARMLNEDETGFDLEGVFIDLESNFRVARPQRVSKTFRRRSGDVVWLTPDRMVMAIQAGASKCMRGATLAGLPAYLVNAYYKKARQIAGGNLEAKADPKVVKAVLEAFDRFKATQADLEKYTTKPVDEWTGSEVADLRGLWNAIQDGQTTAEEVFGKPQEGGPAIPMPQSQTEAAKEQADNGGESPVGPAETATPSPSAASEAPAGDIPPEADQQSLEQEARAREQAEAAAEQAQPQLTGRVDRQAIWEALLRKAKEMKVSAPTTLLKSLTGGKTSLAGMNDAEILALAKKLG